MIPDLCTWAYDLAVSWLPPLPAFLFGGSDDAEHGEKEAEEATTAPATAEALARAKVALEQMEEGGAGGFDRRPLDARFRPPSSPLLGGTGVQRLVGRLQEIDVARLPSTERDLLMGAASSLVDRLKG